MATFLIFLNCIYFVSAFGASADYWDEKPLQLEAGTSQVVNVRLQNLVGDKDVTLRASVEKGEGIATLMDGSLDYLVPYGDDSVEVSILVEVPEDAKSGEIYDVLVSFRQIASPDDSFLQLAGAVKKTFPVEVVKGEGFFSQSPGEILSGPVAVIILVILIIGALIFVYIKNIKRKESKQSPPR